MSMMTRFRLASAAAAAALLLAVPAAAQNNECSMTCNGTDNDCYRSCAGSNDGLSPRDSFGSDIVPAWAASYGAIAVSGSDEGALRGGTSYGYESRASAEDGAMQSCMAGGLPGCRVRIWFNNACAVLVTTSDGNWWTEWRESLAAARRAALATCEQDSEARCTVKEAFCSP